MARAFRAVSASVAAAVAVGALGSIPAGADKGIEVPASVAPARIYVSQGQYPIEDHTFSFFVYLDVCPTPLLELDHTTLVERPKIGSHKGAAIVTAYLRWPAHKENEAPCPPMFPIKKVVHVKTKRPAADLIFFDGSSSPPRRVFPVSWASARRTLPRERRSLMIAILRTRNRS